MQYWIKRSGICLLLISMAYITGCASASRPEAMAVDDFQAPSPIAKSVTVTVSGGEDTSSMGKSQIADADFATAIKKSLADTQVFEQVLDADGEYLLNVMIVSMDQPSFGLNFTVKMETAWRLVDQQTEKAVWEKVIKSEHTATTSDAFAGVERLRLANEGAAKNNIKEALKELGALSLK